jgi:hypothetical protein
MSCNIEWNEKEVNIVRKKYSNPNQFETLEKEKLLLVEFKNKTYNIQSVETGEFYAKLHLSEQSILYYGNNDDNKINEIKIILEEKFNTKIGFKWDKNFGKIELL